MEEMNSIWEIALIALIGGVLIGALGYRKFGGSGQETEQVKAELEAAREELKNYREGVSQHFDKTAELVNDLAQNYVKVYQHLAEGAEKLGDGGAFDNLLPPGPGQASITVNSEPFDELSEIPENDKDLSVEMKDTTRKRTVLDDSKIVEEMRTEEKNNPS